jgi:hypothetical protein
LTTATGFQPATMPDTQPSPAFLDADSSAAPAAAQPTGGVLTRPRRKSDPLASRVMVASTSIGRGVFARRRLSAGLIVGEIRGQVLDGHPEDAQYCMELGSGRILEPVSPFRFLNHSCDPNCELFYWEDDPGQEDRLWLQTIRPINAGEQLLIDYCWPADAAIPCRCGAANCRGWIVDPEELHLVSTATPATAAGDHGPAAGDPPAAGGQRPALP